MRPGRIILLILIVTYAQSSFGQLVHKAATLNNGTATSQSVSFSLRSTVGETTAGKAGSASYSSSAGFSNVIGSINPRLPDLVFTASNVNPATIAPGGSVSVTFTIKNNGDAPIASNIIVKVYLSDDTQLDASDIVLPASFDLGNALVASASIVFPSAGQNNAITIPANTTIKAYQFIIAIDPNGNIPESKENNNFISYPFSVALSSGNDTQSPVFGILSKPEVAVTGSKFIAAVTDNLSGVKEVKFYHKAITSSAAFEATSTTKDGDNYSAEIQANWLDDVGITGYFTAVDNAGNPLVTSTPLYSYLPVPANQSILNLSFGGQPENYRIFSIPYELTDNRIDEVFKNMGDYDKTKWRIVRYQGGRNVDKKEGLTKIERGQAFWFNAIDNTEIRIGTGTTVDNDQSPNFSLSLEKGYNQIGDPFTFDISWANVLALNPTLSSSLSQQVLVYNSANISLDPSDNLKAWGGGFVLADEAMTLSIPVSLKNGGGRMLSTQIVNNNPDLDQWLTTLNIQQDGVLNSLGGIGMHPDAKQSKDIYDIITPPKFIQYVGMNTEHDDFFEPKFSRDIVPTSSTYNWNFTLESNINSSHAEISWNNNELHSANAQLLLYDVSQRTLVDMKQSDRYAFDPHRSRNFRFFFGSDASQINPDIQEIGQVWPNPVSTVANIPYIVKETSHVQIDVYDMTGRRVNRIVDSEQGAGYHTATWNRNSSDGSTVSPGMYLYRMNGSTNVGRIIVN